MTETQRYHRFDGFVVDTLRRELRTAAGETIPVTSKAFDVLCALIDQRERVVGKDELLAAAWAGRVVEENNLTQAIAALRRAFGGKDSGHRFILTVPGRGYRFVAELEPEPSPEPALPSTPSPEPTAPAAPEAPAAPAPTSAQGKRSRRSRAPMLAALALAAVGLLAFAWWRGGPANPAATTATTATTAPRTLVVLPFRTLGEGPPDELLDVGMADSLSTRLGRSPALRVRALASARRAGQDGQAALEAARTVDAAYVVEGTIQRAGNQLRVVARLLSVETGQPVWAETFDADGAQVFVLQDAIADGIARALELPPVPRAATAPTPCEGGDVEAWRALLRAQFAMQRRQPATIEAFHDAIRRDPTCARAYAGLAQAYMFMAHNDEPPAEMFALAGAASEQALRLDADSAEAHFARGRYLQLYAWDWPGAEAELRRAIALNPSLADAHFGLAHLLVGIGRHREGLEHARQARELDPLAPLINALEAGFLSAAGNRRPPPSGWRGPGAGTGLLGRAAGARRAGAGSRRRGGRRRRLHRLRRGLATRQPGAGDAGGGRGRRRPSRRRAGDPARTAGARPRRIRGADQPRGGVQRAGRSPGCAGRAGARPSRARHPHGLHRPGCALEQPARRATLPGTVPAIAPTQPARHRAVLIPRRNTSGPFSFVVPAGRPCAEARPARPASKIKHPGTDCAVDWRAGRANVDGHRHYM